MTRELNKPYLIQVGTIERPLSDFVGAKLSDAVNMEYMGSSEFEFGALPKSFREIEKNWDDVRIRVVDDITQDGKSLRVFHFFNTEEMDQYVGFLKMLRANLIDTKERHRFEVGYIGGRYTTYDFWWDIDNHVMWSFDKNFMNRIKNHVKTSLNFMNEAQANRVKNQQKK